MASRVVVVDDERMIREALARILAGAGHEVVAAAGGDEAVAALEAGEADLVVTDLRMVGTGGLELLRIVKQRQPEAEVIVLTAYGSVESAVEAMKLGAYDYLTKPVEPERLLHVAARAVEHRALRREVARLREAVAGRPGLGLMIGQSPRMREVYETVRQVAPTMATVLVTGESGTGKELLAREIHARSARHAGPFVTLNCGALPDTLVESELFGYERGAFTGAAGARAGRVEQAHGGTLFLDEVAAMTPRTQVDLLRVIQEREVRRLGGAHPMRVDVRFIAASNRDLPALVQAGAFRDDLYYRLAVVPVTLPPLRERREDIPLLATAFLRDLCIQYGRSPKVFTTGVLQALRAYAWPGNVRELRNLVERLVVTAPGRVIRLAHLPSTIMTGAPAERTIALPLGLPLAAVEEQVIRATLREVTSHRERAARLLGISPRALHYKLRRYGIEAP